VSISHLPPSTCSKTDRLPSLFYAISVPDLGKPSNIAISGGISFNYGKNKRDARPEQPQMYRDVEASGGIGIQPHKTGADSPVVG
jgi:hypothetical protein